MLTTELEEKLKKPGVFDEEMIESNAPPRLPDVLSRYIYEKKMTKADVIRILNVDRSYGYQLLNGTRPPTRNSLLQIALILKLDVDQISYLLQLAGKSPLYVRNILDARVFYALQHHMEYLDAVDFIWGRSTM